MHTRNQTGVLPDDLLVVYFYPGKTPAPPDDGSVGFS